MNRGHLVRSAEGRLLPAGRKKVIWSKSKIDATCRDRTKHTVIDKDNISIKDALIQGSLGGNQKMTIINESCLAQADGAFVQFKSME